MTAPQTPGREQEIRARAEAATPGPWTVQRHEPTLSCLVVSENSAMDIDFGYVGNRPEKDAEFVAHAREDIPWLLEQVKHLRTERDAFRDQRNGVFKTNERLLMEVQESDQARLHAENEARTLTREANRLRADRDAAVAAAVRRALEDVGNEVACIAVPDNYSGLAWRAFHNGLQYASNAAHARAAAVASPAREQGAEVAR